MKDLTIENIDKMISEIRKHGGKPNLQVIRCPFCNVLYTYFYEGKNPNIEIEDHREDCSFNEVAK